MDIINLVIIKSQFKRNSLYYGTNTDKYSRLQLQLLCNWKEIKNSYIDTALLKLQTVN